MFCLIRKCVCIYTFFFCSFKQAWRENIQLGIRESSPSSAGTCHFTNCQSSICASKIDYNPGSNYDIPAFGPWLYLVTFVKYPYQQRAPDNGNVASNETKLALVSAVLGIYWMHAPSSVKGVLTFLGMCFLWKISRIWVLLYQIQRNLKVKRNHKSHSMRSNRWI